MSGLRVVVDANLTDTSLPIYLDDPILSTGSLMLVEPAHVVQPWAGVPANGSRVPNIAEGFARGVLGDAAAEVRPTWIKGANQSAANSIFERTAKGGLHGIVSKVDTGAGKGAALKVPDAVANFLAANPSHDIYVSLWSDITRVSGGTNDGSTPMLSFLTSPDANALANYLYTFRSRLQRPAATPAPPLGVRPGTSGLDVAGKSLRNVGTSAVTVNTAPLAGLSGAVASWGKPGINSTLDGLVETAAQPSWVFYRFYIEDLTLSGRSYAEVDALDLTLYTAAMVTAGGKYVGDTRTDPSTLA